MESQNLRAPVGYFITHKTGSQENSLRPNEFLKCLKTLKSPFLWQSSRDLFTFLFFKRETSRKPTWGGAKLVFMDLE